jgi:hypothetical protein
MIHTLTLDTKSNVLRLNTPEGERCYRPTSGSAYDAFARLRDLSDTAPGEVVPSLEDYCELVDLSQSAGLVPDRPTTEGAGDEILEGWYVLRVADDQVADGPFATRAAAESAMRRTSWFKFGEYDFAYGAVDPSAEGGFVDVELPVRESDAGTTTGDMPGLLPSVLPGGKPLKGVKQPFGASGPDRSKGGIFKLEADGGLSDAAVSSIVERALAALRP